MLGGLPQGRALGGQSVAGLCGDGGVLHGPFLGGSLVGTFAQAQ
jgi:hypothetical protein